MAETVFHVCRLTPFKVFTEKQHVELSSQILNIN